MKVKVIVFIILFSPFLLFANKYSDSLLHQLKVMPFDTNRVNTNYQLSSYYSDFNGDSAMFFAKKGDSLARKLKYAVGTADGYFYKALSFTTLAQYDSAIQYYEKDIAAFSKLGMHRGVAYGYGNIARIYTNNGDNLKAYNNYLKAHEIFCNINDSLGIASSFSAIAHALYLLGDLDNALVNFSKSMAIYHKLNMPDTEDNLAFFSIIYFEQGEYAKALKYLHQGIELSMKRPEMNYQWLAFFKNNIGRIYLKLNKLDNAFENLSYADSLYIKAKNMRDHAIILRDIAEVYFLKNQIKEAFLQNEISIQIWNTLHDKNGMAEGLALKGKMNASIRNYNEAVVNYKKAYSYSIETGEMLLQKNIMGALAEVHAKLGDYKNAYACQSTFNKLNDKILNKENITKIARLDLQYQFDKRQKEEELKQKQKELLYISEVKRQKTTRNAILVSSIFLVLFLVSMFIVYRLKHKERMQKLEHELKVSVQQALSQQMNPHFIFNCLNSIYSLMQENRNDEASSYFTMFASLMRKNLEYSQQSAIYISHELKALEMYVKLEQLRFSNLFSFSIFVDEEIDQYTFKIPSLLLQPFVENSILHGIRHKKDGGKIEIRLLYNENEILCSVEDNGIGREQAKTLEGKKEHVSYALSLTQKRLDIISTLFGKSSKLSITDKKDENGNATGTLVEFGIPFIV
jgi:tetratricopeptide (TPR) repeat protein